MISASGVAASLLPALNDTPIEGAKTYQDPAVEEQNLTADGINSTQTIVVGIVPTRPGSLKLPAIEIPWWNTKTDQLEVARIPAQNFNVKASPKNQQITPVSQPVVAEAPVVGSPRMAIIDTYWQYLAIGMFALWLITIVLWVFQARNRPSVPVEALPSPGPSLAEVLKLLKTACRASDANLAQSHTIQWGNLKFSNIHSLQELTKVVGDVELQGAINTDDIALARFEKIRAYGALKMGLISSVEQAEARQHTPKVAFVGPAQTYQSSSGKAVAAGDIDLVVRALSMGQLHHAMMGTAAVAISIASAIPGTLVNLAAGGGERDSVRFGHPSGTLKVGGQASLEQGEWTAKKAVMSRSARVLMEGSVRVPGDSF